ncbi:DUF2057 domain-containing protein [Thalassotalea euphylliae]|uniref:DUF2057 domain-containing protein n=1 Tax=Thalassotalea euphylliae TaxID=1655234 RepID=A0A3E0TRR4_9GAMM|nr:DUF2057 family protein [Thalassotalea euphylliae]REL27173.1 DUF2057 domain-containing protein [Thalassotalea euphylliae]
MTSAAFTALFSLSKKAVTAVTTIALFLLLSLFASTTLAKNVIFPEEYEVLKVNGEKYRSGFFDTEHVIPLSTGRHVILYRYKELFEEEDGDGHVTIRSDHQVLVINKQAADIYIEKPQHHAEKQARAYAKKPKLVLSSKGQQTVDYSTFALAEFEQQQYQSVLDAPVSANQEINTKSNQETRASRALEMLNYWWHQASAQEKAAFRKQNNL